MYQLIKMKLGKSKSSTFGLSPLCESNRNNKFQIKSL